MKFIYLPSLFLTLLFLMAEGTFAQSGATNGVSQSESEKVVRKVRFSGNNNVSSYSLETLVRTRTNREFLGINRFTPWYYTWQLFGVGEEPRYLDRETVANDLERIRIFYENLGYLDVEVDSSIVEYRKNRVEVSFLINEGLVSTINSVAYTGLPEFNSRPEIRKRFYDRSVFSSSMLNDSTFSYSGAYRVQELREEQTRIINFLKDNGYASVQRDSVKALVKRFENNPNSIDILYTINPGNTFNFGNIYMALRGPEGEDSYQDSLFIQLNDSTSTERFIEVKKNQGAQTDFSLLTDQLKFEPGELYNQSTYLRTIRSFQSLGNMTVRRFGFNEETSQADFASEDIPVYFELQTLPRHSINSEFFGMRRYGFGTGAGINYNNNNLFGRAENFTLGLNTNLEFVTSNTLSEIAPRDSSGRRTSTGSAIFQSYEVRGEYSVPRLNFPFRTYQNRAWVENSRTIYSLAYSQSDQLFFDINTDVRFNLSYEVQHSERVTSLLDLFELDIIDTSPSSQFRQNLINEFGENSFEFLRISQDFDPQFSSIIRYSIRNQNTNIIKRNFGYFNEVSLALGGNIPYLLDRFVITPGELEETLPSPFGISSNSLSYSRFLKLSADYRRYIPLTPNTIFAFRLFGGVAQPIGQSSTIPLNRRFFAGGSNDIRGWNPFRLGPGKISSDEVTIPGGEIKLALFKEFRQTFMRDVFSAQWQVAWHTDAGNVWYGPKNTFRDADNQELLRDGKFFLDSFYKQIAVGSGFGLRLDWEFIVARFDFTFRVHDLQEGWFEDKNAYFTFGIGHSF